MSVESLALLYSQGYSLACHSLKMLHVLPMQDQRWPEHPHQRSQSTNVIKPLKR
ncbi:hypothetical protein AGABI1DRAFT_87916 [Agaricus bisporus var. burnettii JB137-S8]|uniref:Uncharacterized protein n=1 Tax=Agaricus bisporus var. burnettii (strain JB137-S8 / ATCC MYA-4627 / FGSC 10392) TaxID=597362 RepID=K5XLF0_AGABU|nr:uncharacterized protein AGABI1DRAFT_87916 [Agaricus bisporus var. burnettii JB137-S8]EKM75355.1 hypothetical protein AGABI1DRAFT_87916 [Agaricus bisporus var. burnettii JB137-S8]